MRRRHGLSDAEQEEIVEVVVAWKSLEEAEDRDIASGNEKALERHRFAIAALQERILRIAGYESIVKARRTR